MFSQESSSKIKYVWLLIIGCVVILGMGQPVQAATIVDTDTLAASYTISIAEGRLITVHDCKGENSYLDSVFSLKNIWWVPRLVSIPDKMDGPYQAIDHSGKYEYLFCPTGLLNKLVAAKILLPQDIIKSKDKLFWGEYTIISSINHLLLLMAQIGSWLVQFTAWILSPLLGLRSFITHPMVSVGWPLILGIANLGFMIALLFIAFATTLRIESMGAHRMLPKLFIAAILINFSLIIAGIFIDASRVVMAIMVNSMTKEGLSDIGAAILRGSGLVQIAFTSGSLGGLGLKLDGSSWDNAFTVLQATILIWVLAAGLLVLTISLLIRYVIIILLLIVSPLAYLVLAFPKGDGLAKKWWTLFIKYVLFGPAALFILILLLKLPGSTKNIFNESANNSSFDNVLTIIITCALCVAAPMAGKAFGTYGANATMGFVGKVGKKALRYTPPAMAGRRAGYQLRDAGKTVSGNLGSYMRKRVKIGKVPVGKYIMGAKRDKDGKLKPGEDSLGAAFARKVTPFKTNEAKAAAKAPMVATNTAYNPEMLNQNAVREALSDDKVNFLLKNGSEQQIKILINDINVVRRMDNGVKADLLADIRFDDQMLRVLRELDRNDSASPK